MTVDSIVKDEIQFCKEYECHKNENEQFIYISKDGFHAMNLPYVLNDYKDWLIENNIVKPS